MKRTVLVSVFIAFSLSFISQNIKITTIKGGKLIKDNNESIYPLTVDKDDKGKYVLSTKEGYITKVVEVDDIIQKGVKEFAFSMAPLTKPNLSKSLKKIKFATIVDKSNKLMSYYYGNTLIQTVNLKDVKYSNAITSKFANNGYNVVSPENELFKEKNAEADYIIAAELVSYVKDTKGTPGFKISMALKWSVFDVSEEKVVLKVLTGGYTNERRRMEEGEAFLLAAEDCVNDLINNPDLIKLVDKDASKAPLLGFSRITIPVVANPIINENNNYIENSVKSVLTIKTNSGHGSGFIVSTSGFVLTNAHVAEDSLKLEGIFSSGLTLPLELVRINKKSDVALLKIPGSGYSPLSLDTSLISGKIGSDVVAIGTPEDIKLGQSVTKGIISGMREMNDKKYIQTDVSINPGNSGGPMINKKGQVVGIVSRKKMDADGIGLAIPINDALKALNLELKN